MINLNTKCETCGKEFHRKPSQINRAKHIYCSKECINYSLVAEGINLRENNGNWRGGEIVTNRGYKKILVGSHPRADRDGYVLEHILVMEKSIGRLLTKKEVVHHIDHNKLNNNIKNLMLFGSHPEHIKYERNR